MATISSSRAAPSSDDRILTITRWVSGVIVLFLVYAFLILYFIPDESGERFAWEMRLHMQAMFIGAGYLGGAYFFLRVMFGRRWHRVAAGFLPVTAFTIWMLALTVIEWDAFDHGHVPFQLWLILYVVTPFLVPWLWFNNRAQNIGHPEANDMIVPVWVRRVVRVFGGLLTLAAILGIIRPSLLIDVWVWNLTPLAARVISGWYALLGVSALSSSREARWSSWRIGLESMALWHILILLAAALNPANFEGGTLLNWYIMGVVLLVGGMVALYTWMEYRRLLL